MAVLAGQNMTSSYDSLGIYIHIPFCMKKCSYCDFYSITDSSLKEAYTQSIIQDIESKKSANNQVDTLYIGGGTPSVLCEQQMSQIINACYRSFHFIHQPEITIEINPGTITPSRLKFYSQCGINRLSIGIQSFNDHHLKFLGRIHSAKQAFEIYDQSRNAGLSNISIDLIFGIPGQTLSDWKMDLQTAISLHPEHLSCYSLSYEPGTPLFKKQKQGKFTPLSDKYVAQMMRSSRHMLTVNGYTPYEISNYSRTSSFRSRHNMKYWTGEPYIGIGAAAHSFYNNQRYWNFRSVKAYIKAIQFMQSPTEDSECLTMQQQLIEWIYLSLRQQSGIDIKACERKFHINFFEQFSPVIQKYIQLNLLSIMNHFCYLTDKGVIFLDGIVREFVDQC